MRTAQSTAMSEGQLQDAVIELARLLGWRVAHFRPAATGRGYRTAVQGDGAGFPDLVLVRNGHLIFAELKADRGRHSLDQHEWLNDLLAVSVGSHRVWVYECWRPSQWLDGTIERVLRETGAAGRVA